MRVLPAQLIVSHLAQAGFSVTLNADLNLHEVRAGDQLCLRFGTLNLVTQTFVQAFSPDTEQPAFSMFGRSDGLLMSVMVQHDDHTGVMQTADRLADLAAAETDAIPLGIGAP